MWWHTQQNNKLLGGQIYHTRYIVLLYRTCPYIVPYAAISCLVLPNCHQCAAIECKSSHKIVHYAAISPSVCYIVSGVLRYANNHATTSSPMLLYRMRCATLHLWAVCQDMLITMPLHRPLYCYIVCSVLHCLIVSGVLRYANNHATTSSPMLLYRMQWRVKV